MPARGASSAIAGDALELVDVGDVLRRPGAALHLEQVLEADERDLEIDA